MSMLVSRSVIRIKGVGVLIIYLLAPPGLLGLGPPVFELKDAGSVPWGDLDSPSDKRQDEIELPRAQNIKSHLAD